MGMLLHRHYVDTAANVEAARLKREAEIDAARAREMDAENKRLNAEFERKAEAKASAALQEQSERAAAEKVESERAAKPAAAADSASETKTDAASQPHQSSKPKSR